jgi:hypothetical protein
VKGICDWGDGTKHAGDQPLAAAAAVDLTCAALGGEGALDGLEKAAGGAGGGLPVKKAPAHEASEAGAPAKAVAAGACGVAAGGNITGSVVITGNANKVSVRGKR